MEQAIQIIVDNSCFISNICREKTLTEAAHHGNANKWGTNASFESKDQDQYYYKCRILSIDHDGAEFALNLHLRRESTLLKNMLEKKDFILTILELVVILN